MAARDENFLDGGSGFSDPFSGLAPALTPEQEAEQRLARLHYQGTQTANINNAPGGYTSQRGASDRSALFHSNPDAVIDAYVYSKPGPDGQMVSREEYEAAKALKKGNHDAMNTGAYKALTGAILAAPAAVTGAGLAIGGTAALGFGMGEGSIAGAPVAATLPEGAPFTMASPFPAAAGATGGATGAGAAGAGGAAASSGGGGAAGFAKNVALPVLGALAPSIINKLAGGETKEQKALVAEQQRIAAEAEKRRGQMADARMDALGQQVLAFNPRNQMLAQMYGPQAAFSPDQAAQMVTGPEPPMDPNILNYTGNDQAVLKQKQELIRRHDEWLAAEQRRRDMMMNNFQAPGAGPVPMNMPAPQAARRF